MAELNIAIYALTSQGAVLALKIAQELKASLFLPDRLAKEPYCSYQFFNGFASLAEALKNNFNLYQAHIIVGATGMVVRLIAPLVVKKNIDPAVVVLGQDGRYVISLLSGHLGGANKLASQVASITCGQAVINTATDLENKPAIEVEAKEHGLYLENFSALPAISRMLVEGQKIKVVDHAGFFNDILKKWPDSFELVEEVYNQPAIKVDWQIKDEIPEILILRPKAFVIGLGCHRGIDTDEVFNFIKQILDEYQLSIHSIAAIASVETRRHEPALLEISKNLNKPLLIFTKEELSQVETPNPSLVVLNRIGVSSVCEAAAMLGSKMGQLIIKKQKNQRVTLAAALMNLPL